MGMHIEKYTEYLFVIVMLIMYSASTVEGGYMTAIGDPGMRRDGLRVAIEAWNQCNEVGEEAPDMGSPRQADCFDLKPHDSTATSFLDSSAFRLIHRVNQTENMYGIVNAQNQGLEDIDVDKYAAWKEVYLGTKCKVLDTPRPWHFWMIMLKSGNMDTLAATCPENGKKAQPFPQDSRFPCFGKGCMNMPRMYHDYTSVQGITSMKGRFYGTWDLDANITTAKTANETSYYSVTWAKEIGEQESWVFHHFLKTSTKYPWLMLYLRSDATDGFSGGYHYQTRGMTKIVPKSPHFKVRFTLDVKQGGGPKSQFYLMDIGSCWKNNGQPCDGNVTTDVTRYSEMIINPSTEAWCKPNDLGKCPPYHTLSNGTKIHRSDTRNFPYAAYHIYCSPGNAKHIEKPFNYCDAYSNPQPQEILQILPHPVWGEYGYPTHKGQGWINDSRTWELDVGRLSQSLYFYQDPGSAGFERHWPSIDLGTEIYISDNQVAEWTVSNFDIVVPDTQSADAEGNVLRTA